MLGTMVRNVEREKGVELKVKMISEQNVERSVATTVDRC
jgi:hypothetical protein